MFNSSITSRFKRNLTSKVGVAFTALALSAGSLVALGGVAEARGVRVVVEPPAPFYPTAQFHYEGGYYRTGDGHYYHYDRDRDGWHYGRNHREGVRWEEAHRRR